MSEELKVDVVEEVNEENSIESIEKKIEEETEEMDEIQFIKLCKLREDNHIHHEHKELKNPSAFYGPHKYVSVSEIFFDLVFVGVASNLAHGLRLEEQSWAGYFQYMVILLSMWKDYTLNQSLFSVGDFVDKCSAFFYGMGIIACACASFEGPFGPNATAFGIAGVYVSFWQLILNLRALCGMKRAINDPKIASHREEATLFNLELQLVKGAYMIIFWIFFTTNAGRVGFVWIIAIMPIIYDFGVAYYLKDDIRLDFNPNVHHFNERFEAIVLIMLGETILGIIPNLQESKNEESVDSETKDLLFRRTIGCIIMGYIAMFLYKTFHFDVEEREGDTHAIYLGGIRKCIWIYATIMECVGILLFGASYGELIEGVQKIDAAAIGHIHKSNELMAVGLCLALGSNLVARLSHKLVLEDFYYAWELYVAQNVFQLIAICLIAPLCHMFSESFLLDHPWIRSFYICCILFILNAFFFIDEIFQFKYLKENIRLEAARLSALEHKSIQMFEVQPRPRISTSIISMEAHLKEERKSLEKNAKNITPAGSKGVDHGS